MELPAIATARAAVSARRLPPLPALRDFLNIYRIEAKKVLSQNFLMDMNVTRKVGLFVSCMGDGPMIV